MNLLGGLLMLLGLVGFAVLWTALIGLGWVVGTIWGWFEGGDVD